MLNDFKNKHKGETAVIIGNGPSLEGTPLDALGAKYITFGTNKIFGRYCPNYYVCADADMLHDCVPWLVDHAEFLPVAVFVPRHVPLPGAHLLNVVIESGFSTDAAEKVVIGGTVTFICLQLAYYMGFTTVLLVGIDHRYPKAGANGRPGSKFIASGDDPDHFKMPDGSPYFAPGRMYNRPELDPVAKHTYPAALREYRKAGRQIINLTPGSALDVFEKQEIQKWI